MRARTLPILLLAALSFAGCAQGYRETETNIDRMTQKMRADCEGQGGIFMVGDVDIEHLSTFDPSKQQTAEWAAGHAILGPQGIKTRIAVSTSCVLPQRPDWPPQRPGFGEIEDRGWPAPI